MSKEPSPQPSPLLREREQLLASFGRRRGRRLRPGRQALVDTLLPELQLTLKEMERWRGGDVEKMFSALFPHIPASPHPQLFLEIGFGGGEHLTHQALQYPRAGIIGCEPYINGIARLLARIQENNLRNIRIYNNDARHLTGCLPDTSLSRVFILYPDPWPKARHRRRRLVATPFLDELARIMKPGAELRLATDDADYATWMLEHALSHPAFTWQAKSCDDWLKPWNDWISTRYEQKALKAGRQPTYLSLTRV